EAYMAIRSKRQALCHGASQTLRSSTYRRQPNSCLSRSKDSRSVNPMDAVFNSIRRIRFRRGPQRLLGGIAGGIANGLNLDVWLVRLLMFLSFLLPFISVILCIVVWIVTPLQVGIIPLERTFPNNPPEHECLGRYLFLPCFDLLDSGSIGIMKELGGEVDPLGVSDGSGSTTR